MPFECAWNHLIMQILLVWPHTRHSHTRIQHQCIEVNDFRIRMRGCIDSDIGILISDSVAVAHGYHISDVVLHSSMQVSAVIRAVTMVALGSKSEGCDKFSMSWLCQVIWFELIQCPASLKLQHTLHDVSIILHIVGWFPSEEYFVHFTISFSSGLLLL